MLYEVITMPKYAFLDPALTVGLPPHITAPTGMDALCHCVEAYTSANATDFSDALAVKAISLISQNIRTAFNSGSDIKARENMLLGSLMAGVITSYSIHYTKLYEQPDAATAKAVIAAAYEQNMLMLGCGTYGNIIRWIPPLIITEEEIDEGLGRFETALKKTVG